MAKGSKKPIEPVDFAGAIADAIGMTRLDFEALVQMGEIKYEDEVTRSELEALRDKHFKDIKKLGGEQ